MALSMFQASVPVYIKMLNGLANCLKKGACGRPARAAPASEP